MANCRPVAGTSVFAHVEFYLTSIVDGVLVKTYADPTNVEFRVQAPDATVSTPAPTQVSTGIWEAEIDATQVGRYKVTVEGTGALEIVKNSSFVVDPQFVPSP